MADRDGDGDTPESYLLADGFDELADVYAPSPGDRDDSEEQR